MSFQAYVDNIKTKTGKTPEYFKNLAKKKGLLKPRVKTGQIVSWLKEDFGLGHGHAMAIVVTLKSEGKPKSSTEELVAKHFTGSKETWRKPFDKFVNQINKFGPDVTLAPTSSYISLLRKNRKFGILQVTSERLDIGIKLKRMKPNKRFEEAGKWNAMVTHRVQISDPKQLDSEIFNWLKQAYEKV